MIRIKRLIVFVFILFLSILLCSDSGFLNSIGLYTVRIVNGDPASVGMLPLSGRTGIYIGHGLVLTAAHVVGSVDPSRPVYVETAGKVVPVHIVRWSRYEDLDLALLGFESSVVPPNLERLPALDICHSTPAVGQTVVIADYGRLSRSVVVSPDILPPGVPWTLSSLIRDVEKTGNSGSGVFAADTGCLGGIMSRKIEWTGSDRERSGEGQGSEKRVGITKYFVSAEKIGDFLSGVSR